MLVNTLFVWLTAGIISPSGIQPGIQPTHLRCEYRINPQGIDVVRPRLSWVLASDIRGQKQTAYQVLVAESPEELDRDEGRLWDSGRITSDQQLGVEYDGTPLTSRMRCWWKVRVWDRDGNPSPWSRPAFWSMGLLQKDDWSALWIGLPRPPLEGEEESPRPGRRPAQPVAMLRQSFEVLSEVSRAILYVTARGVYRVHINGRPVGDHILAPEWTEYDRRIHYQTYDVTDHVRMTENTIGVLLGEGWYAGRLGWENWPDVYGEYPQLLLQLEIELPDGRQITIVSDDGWRGTLQGPIRASGIYDGETIDARLRMDGWDEHGFDDSDWIDVESAPLDDVKLVWQPSQPIGITEELKPEELTEPRPGVYVFDLGQNLVGWCRLKARGPAGTTVTLRHAERLDSDGNIYTSNLRAAEATDTYILSEADEDVFEPLFTYHGFRYVEVTGLPQPPLLDDVTGLPFWSRAPEVGRFQCSNDLVNRLLKNIRWGLRGNLHGIPTDCPQRDERLGWTGDILAFSQTAIFNMDLAAFFTKYCQDLRDGQSEEGCFPDFAPKGPARNTDRFSGVPAWGDAGVVIPWRVYQNYGDRRLLEEHFAAAEKWIAYIHGNNPDLLWVNGRGNDYGDWVNGDTVRLEGFPSEGNSLPKEVLATAFFANSTRIVSRMAQVLGRDEEARRHGELFQEIKRAFNDAYVEPNGRIRGDTQAGYALALNMNLLADSMRQTAVGHLLEAIERYNGHLSTGFHTAYRLMLELSRSGHHEEACRLINLTSPPSWGYMIEQGATTMWERWDGYVEGRGFHDPGMNSFNHYMFGSVGEWVWRNIVGLNPDEEEPAYKHFAIHPRPGSGFSWARGEYESVRGTIVSDWRIDNNTLHLTVTVPANATATILLETSDKEAVTESGRPTAKAEGVSFVAIKNGVAAFHVESGTYAFSAPLGRDH